MILFTCLTIIALIIVTFIVLTVGVGSALTVILFSDVIVCVFIIVWLLRKIIRKRK